MNRSPLSILGEKKGSTLKFAQVIQVRRDLIGRRDEEDLSGIRRAAFTLELAVLMASRKSSKKGERGIRPLRECAADAFRLWRVLWLSKKYSAAGDRLLDSYNCLTMACLGVLGGRRADLGKVLMQKWPSPCVDEENWLNHTWGIVIDVWLRLINMRGQEDGDKILKCIENFKNVKDQRDESYIKSIGSEYRRSAIVELTGLYQLASAAEALVWFSVEGPCESRGKIREILESYFGVAIELCENSKQFYLEPMANLLQLTAMQLVDSSIWTLTKPGNERVADFVRSIVREGREDKALFDALSTKGKSLFEKEIWGSDHRGVVASFPGLNGKKTISQIRILHAISQSEENEGWVAYLAPTSVRASQLTRQMRADFQPMSISVEKLSSTSGIGGDEAKLLQHAGKEKFRVLVTTPEKLDALLRQGWAEKIKRPLKLVVVDDACDIQSLGRGSRLEMLLATIRRELPSVQFLLLSPYVKNAAEVAKWLGGESHGAISFSPDWQYNDIIVGAIKPKKAGRLTKTSFDYSINFESIGVDRKTRSHDEDLQLRKNYLIANTFSKAKGKRELAAVSAQHLRNNGPVIVVHSRSDWVWSIANTLTTGLIETRSIDDDVRFAQNYLEICLGNASPMIDLLEYGIAVYHAGLPDEIKFLIGWLFEAGKLDFLVATTSSAQEITFPANGVVIASHQHPSFPGTKSMPTEDFWNISECAGQASQGKIGVVALVADTEECEGDLREFVNKEAGNIESDLGRIMREASGDAGDFGMAALKDPRWSLLLGHIAHICGQDGSSCSVAKIEPILRETFGFSQLKGKQDGLAKKLAKAVKNCLEEFEHSKRFLELACEIDISFDSITMIQKKVKGMDLSLWGAETLYSGGDMALQDIIGALMNIPEFRKKLRDALPGGMLSAGKISDLVKGWVNGASFEEMTMKYFKRDDEDLEIPAVKCDEIFFDKLAQATSWGLAALFEIAGLRIHDEDMQDLMDLCSFAFHGVNNKDAVALRLLGLPRAAAASMTDAMREHSGEPLPDLCKRLRDCDDAKWIEFFGMHGKIYRRVWRIQEGFES